MDVLQSLKDPLGHLDFSSKPYLFIPWKMNVLSMLTKVGGGDVIRDSYVPVRRPQALEVIAEYERYLRDVQEWEINPEGRNRPRNVRPPTDEQNAASAKYTLNRAKEGILFGKCLDVVRSSLTSIQLASVSNFLNNGQMDDRWKVIQTLRYFSNLYGTDRVQNTNPIRQQMRNIAPARDGPGALRVVAALTFWNDCLRQISPVAAEPDQQLLNLLFEKLGDQMFDNVLNSINDSQVTFTQAVEKIHRSITLAEQRGRGHNRDKVNYDMVQQVTVSGEDAQSGDHVAAVRTGFRPYDGPDNVACWNCRGNEQVVFHTRTECRALHCNNCHKCWMSQDDVGYHVFTECPNNSRRKHTAGGRTNRPYTPLVRVGANATRGTTRSRSPVRMMDGVRDPKRNRRSSGMPSRGAPFQVAQTMALEQTEMEDIIQANVVDGLPDGYEQYEEAESLFEDEFSMSMMTAAGLEAEDQRAVIDAKTKSMPEKVLQDSGANLMCTPPAIVALFPHLKVFRWPNVRKVVFGNKTTAKSTHFVQLGPVLGNVAIVPDLVNTILAVPVANKRGFNVSFTSDLRCEITKGKERALMVNSKLDGDSGLYYASIHHFYQQPNVLSKRSREVSFANPVAIEAEGMLQNINQEDAAGVYTVKKRRQPVPKQDVVDIITLHRNMHHAASPAAMVKALRSGAWIGVELDPGTVQRFYKHQDILACLQGKMNRLPVSLGSGVVPNLFTVCSMDWKPINPTALGGYIGFYLFVERACSFKGAILLKKSPDAEDFYSAVEKVYAQFKRHGHTLKVVRVDAGIVEASEKALLKINRVLGVTVEAAPPECQYMNDVERTMQTVLKGVASMFAIASFVNHTFWGLALIAFIDASNCTPNRLSDQFSPEYYLTGYHPDVRLRFKFYFGQPVVSVMLRADKLQSKRAFTFAPYAEYGYAVGSHPVTGASWVYIPSRNRQRIYLRTDVRQIKLIQSPRRTQQDIQALQPVIDAETLAVTLPEFPVLSDTDLQLTKDFMGNYPASPLKDVLSPSIILANMDVTDIESLVIDDSGRELVRVHSQAGKSKESEKEDSLLVQEGTQPRPQRKRERPRRFQTQVNVLEGAVDIIDDECWDTYGDHDPIPVPNIPSEDEDGGGYQVNATKAVASKEDHPTLGQAMKSEEWHPMWRDAAQDEFNSIAQHGVYDEVEYGDIPSDATIYPTKMVFDKKYDTMGAFIKAKARLVVIGNFVTEAFKSLFAPTVNERCVKLIFILSIVLGLFVTGVDIKCAFLHPEMSTPVYVSLPPRLTKGAPRYWKLKKTLYGLSESPRALYDDCSKLLQKNGYCRTSFDPCMFYKRQGLEIVMVVVHVDDFIIASSTKKLTSELLVILKSRYEIKQTSSLEDFLGINIAYLKSGSILLSQPHKIEQIAKDYNLETVKGPRVPMSSAFNDDYQNDAERCDIKKYLSLLGRLMFIVKTRPDIAYALNRLATRSHCATDKDYKALLRVASYLYSTRKLGLKLNKSAKDDREAATRLACYVDASYATHPDCKSHTGYCFSLGDTMAMFFSRTFKQSNVTLSSTEAENAAAVEATKEVMWFRGLLEELGFKQLAPTVVYCDNASMITMAHDFSGNYKRVKHYMVRVNFMLEQVRLQSVKLEHVDTKINVADILTKPLGPIDFLRLRPMLLGY